jgi:hypothetical protein
MVYANCRSETHTNTGFGLEILNGRVRSSLVNSEEQYYKGF